MANLISTIAINGDNVKPYVDVLEAGSALMAVTAQTGGMILPNVDFRDHKIPVVSDSTLPTTIAEGANKPPVDATVVVADLNIALRAKFRPVSRQLELNQDPADLAASIVRSAVPGFPIAFDVAALGPIVVGVNLLATVEYDAADPIASLSTWLAGYDETSFGAPGMVLTRQGARKLGLATDANARLQAAGGIQAVTGLPSFITGATGTQLGNATLMGIVGPWDAGHAATAIGVEVTRMDQATINGVGPEQNIVNYRVEGADGYANGIDHDATGRGFTILIDFV